MSKRRFDRYIAVITTVIALLVAFITWEQFSLSQQPHFELARNIDAGGQNARYGVVITNRGSGRGTIDSVSYCFSGKPSSSSEVANKLTAAISNGQFAAIPNDPLPEQSLSAQESFWLMTIASGANGFFPTLGQVSVVVKYHSPLSIFSDDATWLQRTAGDLSKKDTCSPNS